MEESYERTVKKIEKRNKEQKAAINFTYGDGETVAKAEAEENSDEDSDDDGPGIALIEEVMNPSQLSDQDRSLIDNRAMDFGIGPGIFVKLLKSDRFYLDEKRQQQEEELELATMNQDKSHGARGRRRRRREKRIKNRIISELPSYAQKPTQGKGRICIYRHFLSSDFRRERRGRDGRHLIVV